MPCEHGVEDGEPCMLCCREGEGKPAPDKKEPARTWEEAHEGTQWDRD